MVSSIDATDKLKASRLTSLKGLLKRALLLEGAPIPLGSLHESQLEIVSCLRLNYDFHVVEDALVQLHLEALLVELDAVDVEVDFVSKEGGWVLLLRPLNRDDTLLEIEAEVGGRQADILFQSICLSSAGTVSCT